MLLNQAFCLGGTLAPPTNCPNTTTKGILHQLSRPNLPKAGDVLSSRAWLQNSGSAWQKAGAVCFWVFLVQAVAGYGHP